MELLWSLPYLATLIWLVPKISLFKRSEISPAGIRVLFTLKALTGITLILIYTYYYPPGTADIYHYFNDGKILYSALNTAPLDYFRMLTGINDNAPHLMHYYDQMNFWLKDFNYNLYNDNRTVIRFNALVMLISFKNIYIHAYIMNILALAGLVGIFQFLVKIIKTGRTIALVAVALPPSLLFWGSGLLKEGIVIFALGLLLHAVTSLSMSRNNYIAWFNLLLALAVFGISKFYVLFAILPALLSYWIAPKTGKTLLTFSAVHILLLAAIFLLPQIGFPDIPELISRKQNDFINYVHSLNHVGSYIARPRLTPEFGDFMWQAIQGFFITLFRPHLFEVHNAAMVPAAFENLATILLIVAAVFIRNKNVQLKPVLICLSFTAILFALAGMSTPVLGALVRYKNPALPFLYGLLLMSIDWNKFSSYVKLNSPRLQKKGEQLAGFFFKSPVK